MQKTCALDISSGFVFDAIVLNKVSVFAKKTQKKKTQKKKTQKKKTQKKKTQKKKA
ncbi:MAG: hypothetical protein ACRBHB_14515 [Arenicella sp.]